MPVPTVQYAFTAGEFSPTLYARTDLEKYDFGVSLAYNVFVDYRGGLSTRMGMEYAAELTDPLDNARVYEYDFGEGIANKNILLFGNNYVRFLQDGGYVLEATVNITGATQATPTVVTAVAHGYTSGDLVFVNGVTGMTELNNRLFVVTVLTTDTFSLQQPFDSAENINSTGYTAYVSGGTVARVYTVTTPYADTDLDELVVRALRDTVRITHPNFKPRTLTRLGATNWTIAETVFASTVPSPTNIAASGSAGGTAVVGYSVTAVRGSQESLPARTFVVTGVVNISTTEGHIRLTWDAVDDVDYYNVYRTTIAPVAGGIIGAERLGFLGIAYAPIFTDGNIIPDFTQTPPEGEDPFADGAIDYINMTAGGTGHNANTTTVSVSGGGGSGFIGYPIVDDAGAIAGVFILNPGSGYSSPVVTFGGPGSGATATATLGATSGNNPRTSAIFQQRQIFGGTDNQPLGVFGSKPGSFVNFDAALIPTAGDSYEFELDAERVNPIRYFVSLRQNLIAFTGSGVWNITGGNDISITPLNVNGQAQTYIGSANVEPIAIDNDILYVQRENGVVRALAYNRISDVYTGTDRSVLSNHLFSGGRLITQWAYAQAPFYLVWTTRKDGRFLSLTYLKEQEVYAWTQHETQGQVKDNTRIEEFGRSVPYFITERTVNGNIRKFVERMPERDGENAEDYMCVDAGVTVGPETRTGTMRVSAATGNVTLSVTGATPFTVGDIGSDVRVNNGVISVTGFTSSSVLTGTVRIALTDLLPDGIPLPTDAWTISAPFDEVTGLWHIEGSSVVALCNGTPLAAQTVENGRITVPANTTFAHIGWNFTWRVRSLPAILRDRQIDGKTRSPVKADIQINLTRGLFVGSDPETAKLVVERSTEPYDTPTALQNGFKDVSIQSTYSREGIFEMRGSDPLPATILGYTLYLDVGDDDDDS